MGLHVGRNGIVKQNNKTVQTSHGFIDYQTESVSFFK